MTGINNDNISKKCDCERFCLILHDMPDDDRKLWQIRDDEEERQTWDLDTIVFWLNRLHKENHKFKIENEQLKSLLECSREEANDYFEELMEKEAFIRVYKEQNEWLKTQLRKGEDVCGICKHQYLTKTNADKYYIAKCKKEHIECSKGTVNYCEDFEYVKILDLFRRITKGDV